MRRTSSAWMSLGRCATTGTRRKGRGRYDKRPRITGDVLDLSGGVDVCGAHADTLVVGGDRDGKQTDYKLFE